MSRLARFLGCLVLMGSMFANLCAIGVAAAPEDKRSDPLPYGEKGSVGDYAITVLEVTPNANDIVAAENQFNDPPKEGNQFYMARIALTYIGPDSGTAFWDLSLSVVGDSGVASSDSGEGCGVIPEGLIDVPELFEGGTVEANICWSVSTTDVETLIMFVEPFAGGKDQRVWFSLASNAVKKSTTTSDAAPTKASEPKHTGDATAVELSTEDIKFEPKELTIPANTDVTITVTNDGVLQHDFAIEDEGIRSALLNGGDSEDVVVNLPPGTYPFICTVPGHKEAGMVGTLIVE